MPYVRPEEARKVVRRPYPSDQTDEEWLVVEPLLPVKRPRGQRRIHSYRELIDGMLYLLREGVSWRALPRDLPPWQTVYSYWQAWQDDGTWKRLHDALMAADRETPGREPEPTAGVIDSQTARTTEQGGDRGYDGGKRLVGRKPGASWALVVDTDGRMVAADVHDADLQVPVAGKELPAVSHGEHPGLALVWADARYRGSFEGFARDQLGIEVEIAEKDPGVTGFAVIARRWVVERSCAWLLKCRRLVRDFERLAESSKALLHLAMLRLYLRRPARLAS